MAEDFTFEHRTVDHPRSIVCAHCGATVPLPTAEPWMIADGKSVAPELESFPCPSCRTRIYLLSVTDEEKARDAESDALDEEES